MCDESAFPSRPTLLKLYLADQHRFMATEARRDLFLPPLQLFVDRYGRYRDQWRQWGISRSSSFVAAGCREINGLGRRVRLCHVWQGVQVRLGSGREGVRVLLVAALSRADLSSAGQDGIRIIRRTAYGFDGSLPPFVIDNGRRQRLPAGKKVIC